MLTRNAARLPRPRLVQVRERPAELGRQRPDRASRERERASANAQIGAAQADRLPAVHGGARGQG
ncbi:hypothetical protein EWW49_28470 [Pseudomonas syringae]|nr:hypothetical protein EWW49_28470 [Pseudomonas syringae]